MRALLTATVIVLFATPVLADDNWTTFTDPTAVFSVEFPEAPTVTNDSTTAQNGATIPIIEYMIDRGTMAMIVMVGDFTGQNVDPQKAVDGAVKGVQTGNRTLLTNVVDNLDGQVGRSVTLTNTDGNQFTDRIFFVNGRLYQAITVVPKIPVGIQADEVARFSNSFHFVLK